MSGRRVLLWELKPPRGLAASGFGDLEREVMDAVWDRGEVSVRDVHRAFGGSAAYTTLATTLDRLYKKGLLAASNQRSGSRFRASSAPPTGSKMGAPRGRKDEAALRAADVLTPRGLVAGSHRCEMRALLDVPDASRITNGADTGGSSVHPRGVEGP